MPFSVSAFSLSDERSVATYPQLFMQKQLIVFIILHKIGKSQVNSKNFGRFVDVPKIIVPRLYILTVDDRQIIKYNK